MPRSPPGPGWRSKAKGSRRKRTKRLSRPSARAKRRAPPGRPTATRAGNGELRASLPYASNTGIDYICEPNGCNARNASPVRRGNDEVRVWVWRFLGLAEESLSAALAALTAQAGRGARRRGCRGRPGTRDSCRRCRRRINRCAVLFEAQQISVVHFAEPFPLVRRFEVAQGVFSSNIAETWLPIFFECSIRWHLQHSVIRLSSASLPRWPLEVRW